MEELSTITCTSRSAGTLRFTRFRKRRNSSAVALREIGDDAPGGEVQGCVEVRDPMPAVVVGASLGAAGEQWQDRGRAVQGLDLGLLVDAEHHRGVRRVQVERDDVANLIDELWVRGELEALREVGP